MTKIVKALLLTGAATLAIAAPAHASPTGGSAYFFGDSLTDCCVYGRTTNGPNWADLLAPEIGETYTATAQSNYAVGGALSRDLQTEINSFTSQGIAVGPNDIAGIWIGTNDVWTSTYAATDLYNGSPVGGPIGRQPTAAALTSYIIGNIQSGINQLKADGFQNIALLSTYDLAQAAVEPNPVAAALATQYSTALTTAESNLKTPGVTTYFVNVQALLAQVQASPSAYGFQHLTGQDSCSANNCSTQPLSVQNTYVFTDVIHLTTAFDQLVANSAASVINPPRTSVPEPSSKLLLVAALTTAAFVRTTRKPSL